LFTIKRIRTILVPLVLLAGVVGPAAGQEIQLQPFRPQEEIASSPSAARAFSWFSRAWRGEDAGQVASLIPADRRASVTIESRGVRSELSRAQVEALLAGLFAETERSAFDVSTTHLSDETSAYAVGDWIYESRRNPRLHRETVFVVFRQPDPGNWILAELRIQPMR
jgi:hypothetical protein